MNVPFSTSEELKAAMSAVDFRIDIENIASSLARVPNDLIEIIGQTVYTEMMVHYTTPKTENTEIWDQLVALCQKAMLPMAMYKHFIWLQIRVSNGGVTTYKGSDETTAYKYQTDEAKESLLDSWADFVSQIIDHLNANKDVITVWPETTQYTDQANNLFTGFREFCRAANISPADAAYYMRVSSMLTDVITDEVQPVLKKVSDLSKADPKFRKAQKYAAFRVLSLSAVQFDVAAMPKPMRHVAINEMNSKNAQEFDHIKGKLSAHYAREAESWMQKLTDDINTATALAAGETEVTRTVFSSTDKIVGIC